MVGILFLIRHGSTENAGEKRYIGSTDVTLTPQGEEQMKRASRFVNGVLGASGERMCSIYCSALKRASRSAEILAEDFGIKPVVEPGLKERHFGQWEGLTFDQIEARWPGTFQVWASDPLSHSPEGGESTIEVSRRVKEASDRILCNHDGGTIAIVAHGGVNRVMLSGFLGVPLENLFRIEQDHGCVNVIEFHNGYPVVKIINWTMGV
jgi:alpha-ribazole phosphatase